MQSCFTVVHWRDGRTAFQTGRRIAPSYRGQAPAGDKPAEAKAEPFTRGEGLPVLPAKVVAKILRGEYVNMADLLQDNIALDNKLATVYSEGVSTGHLKSNKKA